MLELQFPTITRCNVKNLVTTAIGVNDGFRDAWIDKYRDLSGGSRLASLPWMAVGSPERSRHRTQRVL